MPNFNNGLYLRDCIDSILTQSYQNFELIIIDDASTDDSIEIIESFFDERIILKRRSTNGGIVAALNDGLASINTKYIIRHDGDDIMHPHRIKVLVEFMQDHPEIGVCSSDIKTFGAFENELIYERDAKRNKANLIFGHTIGHASSIFRTSLFNDYKIRYSDEYLFKEDYDLFYRLKDKTNFTSIEGFYYLYRVQDRHDNLKQINLKVETTKRFYGRVLSDLNLKTSQEILDIHFELAKNVSPTFELKTYKNHVKSIIRQNQNLKIYPPRELESLLLNRYYRVIYKKIDCGEIGFIGATYYSLLYKKSFFKYRMALLFKRN